MKNLNPASALQELFPEFNPVIQSYGYRPIHQLNELNWEQWLDLSAVLFNKGHIAEANLAKCLGLDLRARRLT